MVIEARLLVRDGDADSHFPSFNAQIARIQSSAPLKASGLASGHVLHLLS
jgi:hypothetical protein